MIVSLTNLLDLTTLTVFHYKSSRVIVNVQSLQVKHQFKPQKYKFHLKSPCHSRHLQAHRWEKAMPLVQAHSHCCHWYCHQCYKINARLNVTDRNFISHPNEITGQLELNHQQWIKNAAGWHIKLYGYKDALLFFYAWPTFSEVTEERQGKSESHLLIASHISPLYSHHVTWNTSMRHWQLWEPT